MAVLPLTETVALPHGPTPVRWRRSSRARRASLRIDARDAAVVITLPPRGTRAAGLRLLSDHAGWVCGKLSALPVPLAFVAGGVIPVRGEPHLIRHLPDGRGSAWFDAGEIHVAGDAAFLSRRVADLLQGEARRGLGAMVAEVAARTGLRPGRIAIRDTRSRWGSCTAGGRVMFNWRLVMAPVRVQHYVVVHELAHLRHMDHGASFWALVANGAPDMAACIAWLKAHGSGLMRAGGGFVAVPENR